MKKIISIRFIDVKHFSLNYDLSNAPSNRQFSAVVFEEDNLLRGKIWKHYTYYKRRIKKKKNVHGLA